MPNYQHNINNTKNKESNLTQQTNYQNKKLSNCTKNIKSSTISPHIVSQKKTFVNNNQFKWPQNSNIALHNNKLNSEYEINKITKNDEFDILSNNQNKIQTNLNIMNASYQSTISSISTQTSNINIFRRASILEEYGLKQLNQINTRCNSSIITTNSTTTCMKLWKTQIKLIIKRSRSCLIVVLDKTRPRCRWWQKIRYPKCWHLIKKKNFLHSNKKTKKKLSFSNINNVCFFFYY